ncbi:MAG: hydroxymethylglutaryl-CoA synthase [Lentisphaeria bacterium]|nr:hydroxymethylglutaryl-CoA synthase [Lentisphaeria bacterium]NQZ66857.1 hydroxymethylglutaryl-CoA synthase [Lentisphaeria bacterium]
MKTGIDDIAFYTPRYYMDLKNLAQSYGVDPQKFAIGLEQEKMAVMPPNEDIITMAANAAEALFKNCDKSKISPIIFASESFVDQAKSGAIHIKTLLGLPEDCMAFDIKQACCGGTYALLTAQAFVHMNPEREVLVICSDHALYPAGSPAEATQGAAAVAMIIKEDPRLLHISPDYVTLLDDQMDFWRPSYCKTACVDGKLSIKTYLKLFEQSIERYSQSNSLDDLSAILLHLPYNGISRKVLNVLRKNGKDLDFKDTIDSSKIYSRMIGNSYTASLYLGFISLMDHAEIPLEKLGFYSYGSGSTAVFFNGRINQLRTNQEKNTAHLEGRIEVDHEQYTEWHEWHCSFFPGRIDSNLFSGKHFLEGIENRKRIYSRRTQKCKEATKSFQLHRAG